MGGGGKINQVDALTTGLFSGISILAKFKVENMKMDFLKSFTAYNVLGKPSWILRGTYTQFGNYNKVAQTRWLINNRSLLLTVVEAESVRSGFQHGQTLVSALSPLLDCRLPDSRCALTWWREALWPLLIGTMLSFLRAVPS